MNDWKDQLKGLQKGLKRIDPSDTAGGKPTKVDFTPPSSWLADDRRPAPNSSPGTGVPTGGSTPRRNPSGNAAGGSAHAAFQQPDAFADSRSKTPAGPTQPETARRESERRTPTFRPRIDPSRRLDMPVWADAGMQLQHPDMLEPTGRPLQVRIGLDLGTAFTKVAVRVGPKDLVLVKWTHVTADASPVGSYLLPGLITRALSGEYCWQDAETGDTFSNLKLPVIEACQLQQCPTAALAYLALVVRYTRAYLYLKSDIGRTLVGRKLLWSLNIGCPTAPNENPQVVDHLQRVADTAWRLAALEHLNDREIEAAWQTGQPADDLESRPSVVPEFVAQIAGYLKQRPKPGLHVLIDIGAATLDVATFNVVLPDRNNAPPSIPILFSAVQHFGTHFLQAKRYTTLGLDPSWDDAAPIETVDEFAERHGIDRKRVETIDASFAGDVSTTIVNVVDGTRTSNRGAPAQKNQLSQYPKGTVWRDGLPLFLTGGGAEASIYRNAVDRGRDAMARRTGALRSFRFNPMNPLGANSYRLPPDVANRLSVAIGLTEDAESIGRIIPHRDMPPDPPPERPRKHHEDIYGGR